VDYALLRSHDGTQLKTNLFDNPCTSSSEKVLHGILFRGGGLVGRHGGGDESMNQASIEATEVWREGWIG
jgi:hypothetical protein